MAYSTKCDVHSNLADAACQINSKLYQSSSVGGNSDSRLSLYNLKPNLLTEVRYGSKTPHQFHAPEPWFIDIARQIIEINTTGRRRIIKDITPYECHLYVVRE